MVIRATFELEPHGSAEALAIEESTGMPDGPLGPLDPLKGPLGPESVRGRVVSEASGIAVIEFPEANWGRNVPMILSALVAGEGIETRAFTRCRLIDLELPEGFLPGPDRDPLARVGVGVIVKPSLGLTPPEVASVAASAIRGGAVLIKDDELLGDPTWCPLEDRVRAVAAVLRPNVIYAPNVTGPTGGLIDRASRAVELGATGVMVNAFTQGLDAVLTLAEAGLGVPIFAHRVGSGPWARNDRFGVSGAVLARLTRLCGAHFVQVGAFDGKLFDRDDQVDDQIAATIGQCGSVRAATAVLGGGIGPENAAAQASRAGGVHLLMLLGSRAYFHPDGLEAGVRSTVDALEEAPVAEG